jgi:hypothetical protein
LFDSGSKFYIEVYVVSDNKNLIKPIIEGDSSFKQECEIVQGGDNSETEIDPFTGKKREKTEKVQARYYPRCVKRQYPTYYYENNMQKSATLNIFAASNQEGKKFVS